MTNTPLANVCEISMGQAPAGESYNDAGRGLPLIAGAGDLSDGKIRVKKYTTAPTRMSKPGDIILGIRATIGVKAWADDVYCLGRGVAGLRPKPGVDPSYLWHWLSHARSELEGKGRGATFLQVNRTDISDLEVPLPPMDEQRRIAAVLDRADELRVKRQASLALLDALNESIFLDMFGDPVQNRLGWSRVPLRYLLQRIDSGKSPVCLSRPAEPDEWGVLKLGAVTWGVFDDRQNKALPETADADPRYEVRAGDLLFTRKNTRDLVGACAIAHESRPRLLLSDLVFRLVPRAGAPYHPIFLHRLLSIRSKRREVQRLAGGSAGSMPNISKSKLLEVTVELPPLDLQEEFARRVLTAHAAQRSAKASSSHIGELFSSLQQRAFAGQP